MPKPVDNRDSRRTLQALTSMVRSLVANYDNLTIEVKKCVLKEVRDKLRALTSLGLSLSLVERSDSPTGGGDKSGTIFSFLCPGPRPMAGEDCYWNSGGQRRSGSGHRSLDITPSDLANGVDLIHGGIETWDDNRAITILQDLAYLFELFEPRG
jgi:hypothetical protein